MMGARSSSKLEESGNSSSQTAQSLKIANIVMGAMGCNRRAHYGEWPCPDAAEVTAALAPLFAAAQAEALREAADTFDTRSDTLLRTMQNMADTREYELADIVRYGAFSAESKTTASWLRTRADKLTT